MTSAQKPVQPRSQDLSLGSVWAFILSPFLARFVCPYVIRCSTFSCHCLIVFIKYFAFYKGLYIKSTMTLEQKGIKQMLAYDLYFALPMRHEYHRRDTSTVVGGFLQGVNLKLWRAMYGLTPETVWNRGRTNFVFIVAVSWLISFTETENWAENVRENNNSLHLNIFNLTKICRGMH